MSTDLGASCGSVECQYSGKWCLRWYGKFMHAALTYAWVEWRAMIKHLNKTTTAAAAVAAVAATAANSATRGRSQSSGGRSPTAAATQLTLPPPQQQSQPWRNSQLSPVYSQQQNQGTSGASGPRAQESLINTQGLVA